MRKIGQQLVEIQESEDYKFGWQSAERGEPMPSWWPSNSEDHEKLIKQQAGWKAYHEQEPSHAD